MICTYIYIRFTFTHSAQPVNYKMYINIFICIFYSYMLYFFVYDKSIISFTLPLPGVKYGS